MAQASHPSSGQEVLYPILAPRGMFEPVPCHGNLWISWNLGTSPCLVPRLCFPGLPRQGAAGLGRAGEKGGVPKSPQLHPSPSIPIWVPAQQQSAWICAAGRAIP